MPVGIIFKYNMPLGAVSRNIIYIYMVVLIGFPYPKRAYVASHLEVSSSSLVYLLKRCSFFIWICRFSRVPVVILMSSA